jgi:hypothetical protein
MLRVAACGREPAGRSGPSFSTTCVVRLGHGDPDNATRPTVVRPVAYHADQFRRRALHLHLHLPAVETSGLTPRTAVLARWRGYVWRDAYCMLHPSQNTIMESYQSNLLKLTKFIVISINIYVLTKIYYKIIFYH